MAQHFGSPVFGMPPNYSGGRPGMLDTGDDSILAAFRRLATGHIGEGHGFSHLNNHRAASAYWMRCLCGVDVSLDAETVRNEAARGVENVMVRIVVEGELVVDDVVMTTTPESYAALREWHRLQIGGHDHALRCDACGWRASGRGHPPTLAVIKAYTATLNIEAV